MLMRDVVAARRHVRREVIAAHRGERARSLIGVWTALGLGLSVVGVVQLVFYALSVA